jgi:hypothetical protein
MGIATLHPSYGFCRTQHVTREPIRLLDNLAYRDAAVSAADDMQARKSAQACLDPIEALGVAQLVLR